MKLENLSYKNGSRGHKAKRVGRGNGSGIGKTSTRGSKGQHSRKSGGTRLGFEGGQTPLYRRIPKIGFNNHRFSNDFNTLSIREILNMKLKIINLETIREKRIFNNLDLPLKIIGNDNLKEPISIEANKFSKGAIKSLEKSKSHYKVI
ncbi:MAG: 50S ribosomal protein L15 [Mycoplasmoidaceae bacterium]